MTIRGKDTRKALHSFIDWLGHRNVWLTEEEDADNLEVVLLAIWFPRESHSCFKVSPVVKPSSTELLATFWKFRGAGGFLDLSAALEELTPFSFTEPEKGGKRRRAFS